MVDGSLFIAGSTITVDANINGDVICAGQNVTLNGDVEGDIICAAQSLTINGHVNGDVRTAVQTLELNSVVEHNVSLFGQKVMLSPDAVVRGEMFLGSQQAVIEGSVERDVMGGAETVDLRGHVGKNVNLDVDELIVHEGASISGNLTYTSNHKAQINQGIVAGSVRQEIPTRPEKREKSPQQKTAGWLGGKILGILSFSLLGLLLVYLWPKKLKALYGEMVDNKGRYMLHGAVVMFLTPILAIIVAITVIGLPLAFVIMLLWLVALVVSRVLVGFVVGEYILRQYSKKYKENVWIITLLGMTVITLAFEIPFLGWLLSLVAFWWGTGALVNMFKPGEHKTK